MMSTIALLAVVIVVEAVPVFRYLQARFSGQPISIDMWMVGALQIQAYRATGEMVYADRAVDQLLAYCDVLQQENGLFLHSEDAPHFWGRGNGWAAASMARRIASSLSLTQAISLRFRARGGSQG